jgi:hypothetical protein
LKETLNWVEGIGIIPNKVLRPRTDELPGKQLPIISKPYGTSKVQFCILVFSNLLQVMETKDPIVGCVQGVMTESLPKTDGDPILKGEEINVTPFTGSDKVAKIVSALTVHIALTYLPGGGVEQIVNTVLVPAAFILPETQVFPAPMNDWPATGTAHLVDTVFVRGVQGLTTNSSAAGGVHGVRVVSLPKAIGEPALQFPVTYFPTPTPIPPREHVLKIVSALTVQIALTYLPGGGVEQIVNTVSVPAEFILPESQVFPAPMNDWPATGTAHLVDTVFVRGVQGLTTNSPAAGGVHGVRVVSLPKAMGEPAKQLPVTYFPPPPREQVVNIVLLVTVQREVTYCVGLGVLQLVITVLVPSTFQDPETQSLVMKFWPATGTAHFWVTVSVELVQVRLTYSPAPGDEQVVNPVSDPTDLGEPEKQ